MSNLRFNWPFKPAEPAPKRTMLNFTPESAKRLKAAYTEACKTLGRDDTFMWEGNEFLVGYAKYLVEYLEMQFGEL